MNLTCDPFDVTIVFAVLAMRLQSRAFLLYSGMRNVICVRESLKIWHRVIRCVKSSISIYILPMFIPKFCITQHSTQCKFLPVPGVTLYRE